MPGARSTRRPPGSGVQDQESHSSRSGMKLPVDSLEPLLINVGVNLCGRDVRVAEHFLDDPQVGAIA